MGRQRHLCILTTAHPLDDVRVYSKVARSFLDSGWRVTWVGPDLNYFAPDGTRDPRISYLLTPAAKSRVDRLLSRFRVRLRAARLRDVDWIYSPDPDAAEVARALRRRVGARVVFDIHEVFHGALLDRWLMGRQVAPIRRYVRSRISRTCERVDLVIGVSQSVLTPYTSRQRRSLVVRNCAPSWFAHLSSVDASSRDPEMLLAMHGKALGSNGTPVVLKALELVGDTPVQVVMFPGLKGPEAPYMPDFRQRVDASGVAPHLRQMRSVEHDKMPDLVASCDVGLIAYGRGLGEDSLPNRIFEYMAAGLAVIVPTYARELSAIVESEDIGTTIDFEKPEEVAAALRDMAADRTLTRERGKRARVAFLERHTWEGEFAALLTAMESDQHADA